MYGEIGTVDTTCDTQNDVEDDDEDYDTGTVGLGGHDCETCGWSPNELTWSFDDNALHIVAPGGCYGGGESLYTEDLEEALEFFRETALRYPNAEGALDAEAETVRALVTAARS